MAGGQLCFKQQQQQLKKKPINNQTAHSKHSSKRRNNNSDRSEKLSELPLHSFIMKSLLHSVVAVVAVVVA
jgi:hypothetical protein